jgi:hypothetical protein
MTLPSPPPDLPTPSGKEIAIAVNTVRRFDVQLSLSTVTQSLDVSASVEALQTDRSDVAAIIASQQITQLPVAASAITRPCWDLSPV